MTTLERRIQFAEKHVRTKENSAWSLDGREWIRDEYWKAIDGFKLWRHDEESEPCDSCAELIGALVESPDENPTLGCECGGLGTPPIIMTLINVKRQSGKTFNAAAYALSTMCTVKNTSIGLIATTEEQVQVLLDENHKEIISRSKPIQSRIKVQRLKMWCPSTGSRFEAMSTSNKSATGRTRTHLMIDEARDLEARVALALIPAVFAMSGVECPSGHVRITGESAKDAPVKCSACGAKLRPWYGRIVITSSSGVDYNDEKDWFHELLEDQLAHPSPHVHVYQSEETINPSASDTIIDAVADVFGRLESTKHYVEAEAHNRWTRKGEAVVTISDVKRVMTKELENAGAWSGPCVGFLDTSTSVEKTSLVILADDTKRSSTPWEYVKQVRLDYWIPAEMPHGVIDESVIREHLRQILQTFSGLRVLAVDTRGCPWAVAMVKALRKEMGRTARALQGWTKIGPESDDGWTAYELRIRGQTIVLQYDKPTLKEFKGLRRSRKTDNKPTRVIDIDRTKEHKDITESTALCCFLIVKEQLKATRPTIAQLNKIGTERIGKLKPGQYKVRGQTFGPNAF